jgi:glycosyltransferase involved in cell wall biosynthesis
VHLTVAGKFPHPAEQLEFERRIAQPDLNGSSKLGEVVEYKDFVEGEEKGRLFRESDCFCFPTFYPIEGQPLCVMEAMAYGLPVITTKWRAMPEFFEPDYPGLVETKAPEQIAAVMEKFMREDVSGGFRGKFLEKFTVERFGERMRDLLLSVE